MLRVMRNHRAAAYDAQDAYEGIEIKPQGINAKYCPDYLLKAATKAWDDAVQLGEKYGYRNAQTTVIAPTGTIGLVMDCDTTGVEPDFALVKFKKLSGGGYFKIINQSVPAGLAQFQVQRISQIEEIVNYAKGHATLNGAPYINTKFHWLKKDSCHAETNWKTECSAWVVLLKLDLYSMYIHLAKNACNA
jgi:ribonucleoside-diphosphate reductase alpha chain